MRDSQAGEQLIHLLIGSEQSVLQTAIARDRVILLEVRHILIDHRQGRIRYPFGGDGGLHLAVFRWQVEKVRRILGIGRPRRRLRCLNIAEAAALAFAFSSICRRLLGWLLRSSRSARGAGIIQQAARAHDVQARKHIRPLHSDAHRAVSAHRMAGQTAAHTIGESAIVRIDIGDQVLSDERFPVARDRRAGVHAAAVFRKRVRAHQNHLFRRPLRGVLVG